MAVECPDKAGAALAEGIANNAILIAHGVTEVEELPGDDMQLGVLLAAWAIPVLIALAPPAAPPASTARDTPRFASRLASSARARVSTRAIMKQSTSSNTLTCSSRIHSATPTGSRCSTTASTTPTARCAA